MFHVKRPRGAGFPIYGSFRSTCYAVLQQNTLYTPSSGIDGLELRVSPTPGHVLGRNGTRGDFLAADKSTGHAVGADLALVDELGLLEERNRGLVNAYGMAGRWGIERVLL